MLSRHGSINLLLFLLWSYVSTVSGRVGNEQQRAKVAVGIGQ